VSFKFPEKAYPIAVVAHWKGAPKNSMRLGMGPMTAEKTAAMLKKSSKSIESPPSNLKKSRFLGIGLL